MEFEHILVLVSDSLRILPGTRILSYGYQFYIVHLDHKHCDRMDFDNCCCNKLDLCDSLCCFYIQCCIYLVYMLDHLGIDYGSNT